MTRLALSVDSATVKALAYSCPVISCDVCGSAIDADPAREKAEKFGRSEAAKEGAEHWAKVDHTVESMYGVQFTDAPPAPAAIDKHIADWGEPPRGVVLDPDGF